MDGRGNELDARGRKLDGGVQQRRVERALAEAA